MLPNKYKLHLTKEQFLNPLSNLNPPGLFLDAVEVNQSFLYSERSQQQDLFHAVSSLGREISGHDHVVERKEESARLRESDQPNFEFWICQLVIKWSGRIIQ